MTGRTSANTLLIWGASGVKLTFFNTSSLISNGYFDGGISAACVAGRNPKKFNPKAAAKKAMPATAMLSPMIHARVDRSLSTVDVLSLVLVLTSRCVLVDPDLRCRVHSGTLANHIFKF